MPQQYGIAGKEESIWRTKRISLGDELVLADKDMDALGAAAVFHDSRRRDDWMDVGHGQRAADYYRDYCRENQQCMDERTYLIMAFHDRDDELGIAKIEESGTENGILLYRIFKDSDGLDRYRLGPNALDVNMLRTEPARTLVKFAQQLSG